MLTPTTLKDREEPSGRKVTKQGPHNARVLGDLEILTLALRSQNVRKV